MADRRFLRNKKHRALLYYDANGKCQMCGCDLPGDWHADHIEPWSSTGRTNVHEMQALCPDCNQRKGDQIVDIQPRKFWIDTRNILEDKIASGDDKLVELSECGSGKSSLPPLVSYMLYEANIIDGLIWSLPRINLAKQAVKAMSPDSFYWQLLGLPPWETKKFEINYLEGNEVNPTKGSFGYAVSYNSIERDPDLHIQEMKRGRYLLVSDEIQFCAKGTPFGNALEALESHAVFHLIMSGDFDRDDGKQVACVKYIPKDTGSSNIGSRFEVDVDVYYNLSDAIRERAILKTDFGYGGGSVSYYRNGEIYNIDNLSDVDDSEARPAVWAAVHSEYGYELLDKEMTSWEAHRTTGILPQGIHVKPYPDAQNLVVCANTHQSETIHRYLTDPKGKYGYNPAEFVLIDHKQEDAMTKLDCFCENKSMPGSNKPVIGAVTVAMAYVGTDAPDVTHLCCLTNYRSAPWLHQMIGRAWRLYSDKTIPYEDQYCVVFAPDDPLWQSAIEDLKRLQQAGIIMMSKDTQEEQETGDEQKNGEANDIIVDWSKLTSLYHKYEFIFDKAKTRQAVLDPSDAKASNIIPNRNNLEALLHNAGLNVDEISVMLSALEYIRTHDGKSVKQRNIEASDDLEGYQRKTVKILEQLLGRKAHEGKNLYAIVNGELKRWTNQRDELNPQEKRRALANVAPKIREKLVWKAQRGLIQ